MPCSMSAMPGAKQLPPTMTSSPLPVPSFTPADCAACTMPLAIGSFMPYMPSRPPWPEKRASNWPAALSASGGAQWVSSIATT